MTFMKEEKQIMRFVTIEIHASYNQLHGHLPY